MEKDYLKQQREYLLDILSKDIHDKRVLKAISEVKREEFVSTDLLEYAYINAPLDIGYGQTISQPYIVALMCELLELKDTDIVLDIGTGCGYQAAVLSKLCKRVVSVEIVGELAKDSKERLKRLGYFNIKVIQGDGYAGYAGEAPYNKIVCAAVSKEIPYAWKEQLLDNGVIVTPLYTINGQELIRVRKSGEKYTKEYCGGVVFVPLVKP